MCQSLCAQKSFVLPGAGSLGCEFECECPESCKKLLTVGHASSQDSWQPLCPEKYSMLISFSRVANSSNKCGTHDHSFRDGLRMREKKKMRFSVCLLTVKLARIPRHWESPCLVLRVKLHLAIFCAEHS